MDAEAAEFTVSVAPGPDAVVVTLEGELDLAAAPAFVASIDSIFAAKPRSVTLDLAGVTFLDSSGLGALLSLDARCRAADTTLSTVNAPRQVRRVLELTRLSERFNLQ